MTTLTASSPKSSWYNPGLAAGGTQDHCSNQRMTQTPKWGWL